MAIRKIPIISGEYYHIYNRGNSKQTIFHDKQDYNRFLKLIFLSNGEENFKIHLIGNEVYDFNRGQRLVGIGAYCLMPNHFHLLLTQYEEGSISKFMQKVSTGYSMYYNNKYERTGTLFEGKFKAQHVEDDRYLKYLFSYINLNPAKLIDPNWKEGDRCRNKELGKFVEKYSFSSYLDYTGCIRPESKILNKESFPDYFSTEASFKNEVLSWLNLPGKAW